MIEHKLPARLVQAGWFVDSGCTWEIVRVEIERDDRRRFVQRVAGRPGPRWSSPPVGADTEVTVYEKERDCP